MNSDAELLVENGGHIDLIKHWAKNLLTRMNFVKKKSKYKSKS